MGREGLKDLCLIKFSNRNQPGMQTRKERAEISISDPGKKTYLSSDRDSIAVDRGRARDGLYII